ncbi:hypothetical protein BDV32DRAFT_149836 [Aspergillus pseudonomiae]|uniref:Uncharacterized protein n=1 Tax=Aspergillus pseudonomiae TaxID=1506151 RepID=A0A5N6I091_9EURO|nr:uncharacterized protein BDV37DRAFT_279157 [Aspergillus pseudonomiae]KAB8260105.1 hypothetical protein BDV32DRAFT_149836 [Aspergillus pseudonomiae]KAE8408209.1 hypothetical protein BDV37DRAFT_279157 [Aspergillus pseudonomiae]
MENRRDKPIHANRMMRAICIGAGPSGLYLAYMFKTSFTDYTLEVYEKNEDIGGTWFENRYPGCTCDVPSHMYTYSFEPKWDWSASYASAPGVHSYFSGFADKHGLRDFINCNHRVVGANWDDANSQWKVRVENANKEIFEKRCDFLINATGYLNSRRWPSTPGLGSFNGRLLHTADWDESLSLTGKRVGLIGNGSSGIQLLPGLQRTAEHVTAFMRRPTWVIPKLRYQKRSYTDEEKQTFQDNPRELLRLRKDIEANYATFLPLFLKDTPSTEYLGSLQKPNVTPVIGNIKKIIPSGGIMLDGSEYAFDVLVCATGFHTSFRPAFPLIGRDDTNLAEAWEKEPRSYLGVAAHGFPNYFMLLGPNSPLANSPVIVCIEAQGHYIARFLNRWQKEDIRTFEPKVEAVDDFMEQKDLFMKSTVWESDCRSWFKNANTGNVSGLWPGSGLSYIEALAVQRFEDFHVTYAAKNRFAYLGNGFSQTHLQPESDLAYYVRHEDNGESVFPELMSVDNAKDTADSLAAKEEMNWLL